MKNQLLHCLASATLLCLPYINFAQAPDLGAAATFVLFSSNGAVSNSGTPHLTHLTGNVGTNNGAVTGFGNVNGVMHNADTLTARAAADLLTAYNQLDSTTPTFFHAPALGNGDTLTPGVYSISGNTTLNLNLTLNAQGNPNAVFIFQVGGTFSTADSAKIILIDSAMACNVFWKVEGLVSLTAGTSMKGNIIANNAAININTDATLEGRALSTTGAVSVSKVLAYTPTGCGSPLLTGPAAPTLGSTACYGIFSGNGSVMNNGITHVTGDVGTNAGLAVGYNAMDVNGMIHPLPDMSTATCATDLGNVNIYLTNLPYDIELLFPPQFGNSLVLTPHTYLMNGATVLTDTLYLDAEGNADAVFVIKISGAFSTGTFAKVLLMNGAQASNVYWKVDGAVSINDSTQFKGMIVCNNGAISLTTGVALAGRALTTSGAFSTAAVNITNVSANCGVLPVSWIYFNGKPTGNSVLLQWGISNEINNGLFTIEKSSDGNTFQKLTTINAAIESGKKEYQYSFTDEQPYSLNYYRISQTDKDGKISFFHTIQVKVNINAGLNVIHYIQNNYLYLQVSGAAMGNGSMELYSMDGKKISAQKILLTREMSTYTSSQPLNKGVYIIVIESNGEKLYHGKVMVL